jgi:NAD(P)H dehydrogenase (quinone)
MTKVLILYYSAYGHMERMSQAVAEGVREARAEADIKRVPELVLPEVAKQSGLSLIKKRRLRRWLNWPTMTRSYLGLGLGSGFSRRRCAIFLIKLDRCG